MVKISEKNNTIAEKRVLILFTLLITVFVTIVAADVITTPVRFIVASDLAFVVAVPSTNATNITSGGTSATIVFNTTAATAQKLNATILGSGGAAAQTSSISIFRYYNTGNVNLNISLTFNAALPTGVRVKAGWADGAWQSSCGLFNLSNNTFDQCANVSAGNNTFVANLTTNEGYRDVWLWADYSSVSIGTDNTINLNHTSSAA